MMLTFTLKSLLSRKLRLVLSGLAVVLAVMFVSGSMVIKDTLNRSIDAQFTGAYADIDLHAALKPAVEAEGETAVVPPVDAAAVERASRVDGVAEARGLVLTEGARVIGKDGKVVPGTGGPRYGESWRGESGLIKLRSGHGPRAADEVAVNAGLAEKAGIEVGDRVGVLTNEPRQTFVVAGVFGYSGDRDSIGGEQTVAFTDPVAQRLMLGRADRFSGIEVTLADGAAAGTVRAALGKQLGGGYDVLTGKELAKKASDKSRGMLDMMGMLLLGFAGVAVFVGVFLIVNTFSIIIAQRMRELALLRALGASRKQMINSVLVESFVVGLVSSVLGLAAGVGIGALGADMMASSTDGLQVAGLGVPVEAVVTSFAVGILVTMLSALFPAVRASKVAPIAVIRAAAAPQGRHRGQTWTGGIMLGLGALLLAAGLFGSGGASLIIPGVLLAFVGVSLLTPLFSKPSVQVLGAVFARSTPGSLGRANSALPTRLRTSSLRWTLATWVLAVPAEMKSSAPISALVIPLATSRAISVSRPVNASSGSAALGRPASRWCRSRLTVSEGLISVSPAIAARTASTSSVGPDRFSRKPQAPLPSAVWTYSSSPKVVTTTTRIGFSASGPASRRVTSRPSRRGMRMSASTTSGFSFAASSTA
ncbi:hypothetical protein SGRI78S_04636 [Streptomyces griseus subsp. griseus]